MNVSIFDPTGNITALVSSPVAPEAQSAAAREILRLRPEVEQVGFFTESDTGLSLRTAGGEFCGNAAMSAAALALLRRGVPAGETGVSLRVSGASAPVEVRLRPAGEADFQAAVKMPPAREIRETALRFGTLRGTLPVVWMQGISHILIEPDSVFWPLLADRRAAEQAVNDWCAELDADGLGLMFLDSAARRLTPLVYVPGSGTCFWENACASGTSAVGMALSARTGGPVDRVFREPGGTLRVTSEAGPGETWIYGRTRRIEQWTD